MLNVDIQGFRRKVISGKYEVTNHAKEEAAADDMDAEDLESIVLSGEIVRKLTKDPRGTRYSILGKTRDEREAELVCRPLASGKLRFITVYLK